MLRRLCLSVGLGLCMAVEAADPKIPKEPERVAAARRRVEADIRRDFSRAGVVYPPAELFLRAIKDEDVLELWAASKRGQPMTQIKTFRVCARSGGPGPKRQRGDGQVPEGFYSVDRFNPWSDFHLSLGLDYPNPSDRIRRLGDDPGGDIFVHGGCATIGCLPLEDGPMEELYVIASDFRRERRARIPVHLFPTRLEPGWENRMSSHPSSLEFWRELAVGYSAFEALRRPPMPTIDRTSGSYVFPVRRASRDTR